MTFFSNKGNLARSNTNTLWNKSFIYLIFVSFITAMGFNMVYTIISKYAINIINSLVIVGVISGIFSAASLIIRPFAGITVDTFNKKYLFIISNVLIGISIMGYAFSSSIFILIFFRILHGVSFSINHTVNIVLVTKYIPKDRLGEGISYFGICQVLTSIIGPNIGIYIADICGFKVLFLFIALLSFLASVMLFGLHYPDKEKKEFQVDKKSKRKLTIKSFIAKEVIVYTIIGGMFSLVSAIVSSFLILLVNERNILNIGLFFSVGASVVFILRLFIGRIVDKKGLTTTVNISLIVSALSMALIGIATNLGLLIFASVLKAIGQGAGQVSLQSESIKSVNSNRAGVAASTFYIGGDIGFALGPIIGGGISGFFNYTVMFMSFAILILASMIIFNIHQKKIKSNEIEKVISYS